MLAAALALLAAAGRVEAAVSVALSTAPDNPAEPRMGDRLGFRTSIRNDGQTAVDGLIAWISLVQTDPGNEQPVDLEDWSAHKAIAEASLAPGQTIATEWPMRLIRPGHYRVVVSVASRTGSQLAASPFADFEVRSRPVVESARVLPVALGMPLLLGGLAALRRRQVRTGSSQNGTL